jgi:hypothetical protein
MGTRALRPVAIDNIQSTIINHKSKRGEHYRWKPLPADS